MTTTKPSKAQLAVIRKDFESIDVDKSGFISNKELESLVKMQLGRAPSPEEVHAVSVKFDTNEDGKISFDEWVDFVFQPTKAKGDDEVRNLGSDWNLGKKEIEAETKKLEKHHAEVLEVRAICQMLAKFNKSKGFYEQDAKAAKKAFQKQASADKKANSISPQEFRTVLKTIGFSETQIEEAFDIMDLNDSQDIDFTEFKAAFDHYERFSVVMRQIVPHVIDKVKDLASAEQKARECFKGIKEIKDDDLLTAQEFSAWLTTLHATSTPQDVDSVFMVLDADGTGRIRCGEFVAALVLQFDDETFKFDAKAAKK